MVTAATATAATATATAVVVEGVDGRSIGLQFMGLHSQSDDHHDVETEGNYVADGVGSWAAAGTDVQRGGDVDGVGACLLYTSPSPRD